MTHAPHRNRLPARPAIAALSLALLSLAACGGEEETTPEAMSAAPPLFDLDGRPLPAPASLLPTEAESRTQAALYATRTQYDREALTAPHLNVLLDMEDIGSVELAVEDALRLHGWHGSPRQLAFYVQSRNAIEAAHVANRLAQLGVDTVFVIRPAPAR